MLKHQIDLKNQNDLKKSIKNLYIGNQNKKKTINEYAQLTTQIREEYAKLQNENNQLKSTLEKYKQYIEEMQSPRQRSRFYKKSIREKFLSKITNNAGMMKRKTKNQMTNM